MDEEGEYEIKRARDAVQVIQSMIDISSDRLEGLRTHCATSAELTQQEIRTLEGKLIKLFSRQLVTKGTLKEEELPQEYRNLPCLSQWLRVVGLSQESIETVCNKTSTLQALQERSEHELRALLSSAREEEVRRLCRAMFNLKKYTEVLIRGGDADMALYWDSWDRHHLSRCSPRPPRSRAPRPSLPGDTELPNGAAHHSPPPSPAASHPRSKVAGGGVKFPTTPPPRRRHQTTLPAPGADTAQPLIKSRSHESQLGIRPDALPNDASESSASQQSGSRSRLEQASPPAVPAASPPPAAPPPAPPHNDHHYTPHADENNTFKSSTLSVPRSPRTPTVARARHSIAHRFTKTFKMIATCDYCDKQMLFGGGLKCKECKFKCHKDCESKVPPSCGLPPQFVSAFKAQLNKDGTYLSNHSPQTGRSPAHALAAAPTAASLLSSITHRARKRSHPHQLSANAAVFPGGPDSSSNTSSCNSSTPSSPALAGAPPPATPRTPLPSSHSHLKQHFHFPEVKKTSISSPGNHQPSPGRQSTPHHQREDLTTSARSGTDSSRTVSLSGSASTDEERTPQRTDSLDEGAGAPASHWPRQNSLSMKEWDIPFDELRVGEALGPGRFGTVYRGSWHGAVAVKLLNVQYLQDDEGALDSFKHEVATFRKTRHENLVLFMGACMKPPRLAIVTSLCKGMTLYTHIHLRKDKFNANKSVIVAQQISQGMGYLHARGIIHKDLKSKNIFLENGKVVITDFGLFSVTKLCFGNNARGDSLGIPAGWLCYLAPEIVRALRPRQPNAPIDLPFSKASDVYAFGTVWYELLCGEWPFKGQPPEAVIWQVGKGVKQSLNNLQASRDVKDILMLCWSYRVSERPDFAHLLSTLEKLPRKRLARSPSHPVHLSRSAESVF